MFYALVALVFSALCWLVVSVSANAVIQLTGLGLATGSGLDRYFEIENAAGGAAVYARSPLQRHLRDVHTITQHIMVAPGGERLIGRALLGLAGDYGEL